MTNTTTRRRTSPERIAARNERIRQADAERTARAQRRANIAAYFADDSEPLTVVPTSVTKPVICPTCGASGMLPCMTRAGKLTKRHTGRAAA